MMRRFIFTVVLSTLVWSCSNDDDNDGVQILPPRPLSEVAAEDDAEIREFLQTHFYNYEEFQNPPADFDFKIRIDTIAGENADKIPLIDQVESAVVNVSDFEFGLSQDEENVPHKYYFLEVREGEGVSPTIADSTLLRFEGSLLNGNFFDATPQYSWQPLAFSIRGYSNGISNFKSGTNDALIVNSDGTSRYANSGIGIVIMPSGLGYFSGNGPGGRIPSYSPLIFTIEVGNVIVGTDTDNDGIPSIMEDLDGDGYLFNDNTDAESEANARAVALANFRDPDDDDDGIPTRDEIEIDGAGNITFPDSDGDGTPDYLDSDS
ncbi:MAG: hypothetical protein CMH48_02545 [Muricauda sp.]|nr:hypothetical protein [Allomuricauda sp.]MAU26530.1 hypothetical protein [Allomuricauda sp.]MBC29700.1 hypothetical protein [Allomuricauda sp.]|tara:strand:+ start:12137 stop:13096 length:960 start_codon:yes stop_codon:yes gene_type:complete